MFSLVSRNFLAMRNITVYSVHTKFLVCGKRFLISDLVDFEIFSFAILTRVSLWGKVKKTNKSEPFVIQRSVLLFRGWQPNFQKWLPNFEVAASKFNIDRPLTSMASKTARANILKIASNHCICSKDWWELWIVGRDCKKKSPQQWGVRKLWVTPLSFNNMTTLLANRTEYRFLLKNFCGSNSFLIGLEFTWVWVDKKGPNFRKQTISNSRYQKMDTSYSPNLMMPLNQNHRDWKKFENRLNIKYDKN